MNVDVVFVGQVARDLVLRVEKLPDHGTSGAVTECREILGGKGANQAVACAQLGLRPAIVGVIGDDDIGRALMRQAVADGIDVSGIVTRSATPTGLITEVIDADGHWRYLEHLPDGVLLTEADVVRAAALIAAAATTVVQLQQPGAAALRAAQLARESDRRVLLDGTPPEPEADDLLAIADALRADTNEASLLSGHEIRDAATAIRAAREIRQRGPSIVVAGAADDGDVLVWDGGEAVYPHVGSTVTDTTGAGDALVAALAVQLTKGADPAEAMQRAAVAAGIAVRSLGGRPHLTPETVETGAQRLTVAR